MNAADIASALKSLGMGAVITTSAPGETGYWKLSDSVIVQWGKIPPGATDTAVSFKIAFPTGCWGVIATPYTTQSNGALVEAMAVSNVSKTGFTPIVRYASGGASGPDGSPGFYIALGN